MNTKLKIQSFGRSLSAMVMPNIAAFIAWGLITALFIPTGWLPNEKLATLVGPMITYMLRLLIAYSGGKLIGGERGGVVGVIMSMGVIVSTTIPMFLGAMIAGPIAGYTIKKIDRLLENRVRAGFEMLVNNFSAGIVGMILALFAFIIFGPIMTFVSGVLETSVNFLVQRNLLFLTSIIVEPAKVLFLNNAINHGVFSPLGLEQAVQNGKSIFFLIETNPGPGLGILLSYALFGKGAAKTTSPGAIIIHFFGGIHEIYFPYILMKPKLILAAIAGGMSGVATNSILGGGLVAPPSPGSIFALLTMTPKGGFIPVILSVIIATIVSFLVGTFIIKASNDDLDLEQMQEKTQKMKNEAKGLKVTKIAVACDAGMGSSAMGATMLKNELKKNKLNISVINLAIDNLTEEFDVIITHESLEKRAQLKVPNTKIVILGNFMDPSFYQNFVEGLK